MFEDYILISFMIQFILLFNQSDTKSLKTQLVRSGQHPKS